MPAFLVPAPALARALTLSSPDSTDDGPVSFTTKQPLRQLQMQYPAAAAFFEGR
jgi:hypothetical protein